MVCPRLGPMIIKGLRGARGWRSAWNRAMCNAGECKSNVKVGLDGLGPPTFPPGWAVWMGGEGGRQWESDGPGLTWKEK